MATRTSSKLNATVKPTAAQPEAEQLHASHSTMREFADALGLPSAKRGIIALVAMLLISGGVTYLGMQLTAYMALGAAVLTGSAFITFMVLFIGYALSILVATILGGKMQTFILDGSIDRTYESAKTRVTGWFGKAKAMVTPDPIASTMH